MVKKDDGHADLILSPQARMSHLDVNRYVASLYVQKIIVEEKFSKKGKYKKIMEQVLIG